MHHNTYILLINRDKRVLETTHSTLCKAGYLVLKATDTDDALCLLNAIRIGLIICDNALRDSTGREFLTILKKDPLLLSIPFIFFVPVNDRERASEAFAIGASDFIVHPLDDKILIERIREIMPLGPGMHHDTTIQAGEDTALPETSGKVILERDDRRESERKCPLASVHIEISRDGVLWMPGQLQNINRQGIFAETSLLGKPGSVLHIKILLSDEIRILKGSIKHITFSNPQHPTGIGIEIEETQDWRDAHEMLAALMRTEDPEAMDIKDLQTDLGTHDSINTIILPYHKQKMPDPSPLLNDVGMMSEETLDVRFYHSLVGKQLGNYKAVSFIGAGTMGGVFKGWDVALERTVALKVISYKLSSHETFRNMFIKEARTISQLNHPNIAHIYYIGNMNEIIFFAMEFIHGKTLADLIKEYHNLDISRGLQYFITVCLTLDFVSKKNIIHRDVKPENIMITDKGMLKVVDFGVAKITDGRTREINSDGIVGSPLYISPDCIKGHSVDCRSDIYSLGATFYHAFSGSPPFEGKDTEDVLRKHLHENPVPLQQINPHISHGLSMIIRKMMDKEPENRYQNYQSIIDDLEPLMAGNTKFH
jgi:CheY-like chemotaxis protein/predicted Ser/Thr protein kinase